MGAKIMRLFWYVLAFWLVAACVPWYARVVPELVGASWLGIPATIAIPMVSAVVVLGYSILMLRLEDRRRDRQQRLAAETIALGEALAADLQSELSRQAADHGAQLRALEEPLATRRDELDTQQQALTDQQEAWQRTRREAEVAIERQQNALQDRATRLATATEQFDHDRERWEEAWRHRENDLATRCEQFDAVSKKWTLQRQRREQELEEIQAQLAARQTELTAALETLDREQWEWKQQQTREQGELDRRRAALEAQVKQLEIDMEVANQRLRDRAEQLADRQDRLERAETAWNEHRAEEHSKIDQRTDELHDLALSVDRKRECAEHEIAKRLSRLEQQEARLAASEKAFQEQAAGWEEHKRIWENEFATRSEQAHREASKAEGNGQHKDGQSEDDELEWAELDTESRTNTSGSPYTAHHPLKQTANVPVQDNDSPMLAQRLAMLARRKKK